MSGPHYLTTEIENTETTEEQRRAASLAIARYASTQDDSAGVAGELLDMLGLRGEPMDRVCRVCGKGLPESAARDKGRYQRCCSAACRRRFLEGAKPSLHPVVGNHGRCTKCGVPTYEKRTEEPFPGAKAYGGRGMCGACYKAVRKAEKEAAE